jgi:hypothetical protein
MDIGHPNLFRYNRSLSTHHSRRAASVVRSREYQFGPFNLITFNSFGFSIAFSPAGRPLDCSR